MSLTSRISNLFSTNPAPHLAPADGHKHIEPVGGERVSVHNADFRRKATDLSSKYAMEEEEESRPPYLQVRLTSQRLVSRR